MSLARSAVPNALLYPFLSRRRRRPVSPYQRAAIFKLGKLGDAVLALGAIRTLVEHFGPRHCALVCSPYSVDLMASEFPSVERLTVTTNHSTLRRTLSDLRRHRDHPLFRRGVENLVSLQHHRTIHDDTIISAVPAARSWGLANSALGVAEQRDQIVTTAYPFDIVAPEPDEISGVCRELALHSSLLSAILGRAIAPLDLRPRIGAGESAPLPAIGLAPFSGSALRDLPMPLLVSACEKARLLGLSVHLWSASPADPRVTGIAAGLNRASQADVAIVHTRTTAELIRAISCVRLAVAAESAPAHIAAALDRPLLAVLGGGHFGWFAPWATSGRQRWIFSRQPCYSCNWRCIHPEPICITQIADSAFRRAMDEALAA